MQVCNSIHIRDGDAVSLIGDCVSIDGRNYGPIALIFVNDATSDEMQAIADAIKAAISGAKARAEALKEAAE
jgi:uncharacterized protein YggE